jgi:uncharacterized membrane protein
MAPPTASIAIETLHVLSAIVVVGYYAIVPMWKGAATKSTEPAALRLFFHGSRSLERRAVYPALGALLLTGLLMAFLPRPYNLIDPTRARTWILGVIAITIVLGVLLWSLSGPSKRMQTLAEAGETSGPAMDKLWGEWRTSLGAGAILSIVAVVLMVYQGSL